MLMKNDNNFSTCINRLQMQLFKVQCTNMATIPNHFKLLDFLDECKLVCKQIKSAYLQAKNQQELTILFNYNNHLFVFMVNHIKHLTNEKTELQHDKKDEILYLMEQIADTCFNAMLQIKCKHLSF